jgi:hypothetical protein
MIIQEFKDMTQNETIESLMYDRLSGYALRLLHDNQTILTINDFLSKLFVTL